MNKTTTDQIWKDEGRYLAPADESRAERGLETGLITRERSWLEVDGKRLPSARPTLDEIREAML